MKFVIRIDDRAWAKFQRRMEQRGLAGTPAEILEAMVGTSIMGDDKGRAVGDVTINETSTSLMMILGRLKVEQVEDDARSR